jgi:hypothetical protein
MKNHPYADIFPMMNDADSKALVGSIRENGLQHSIITYEGMILDGRNRAVACEQAGIEPVYEEYTGTDALQYVVDSNLNRRHLTTSQRAMIAAELATMRQGERTDLPPNGGKSVSTKQAAAQLKVGTRTIERAKKVIESGDKDAISAVEAGRKTLGQIEHERNLAKIDPKALEALEAIEEAGFRTRKFIKELAEVPTERQVEHVKNAPSDWERHKQNQAFQEEQWRQHKEEEKKARIEICDILLDALKPKQWDKLIALMEDHQIKIEADDLRERQSPSNELE